MKSSVYTTLIAGGALCAALLAAGLLSFDTLLQLMKTQPVYGQDIHEDICT